MVQLPEKSRSGNMLMHSILVRRVGFNPGTATALLAAPCYGFHRIRFAAIRNRINTLASLDPPAIALLLCDPLSIYGWTAAADGGRQLCMYGHYSVRLGW